MPRPLLIVLAPLLLASLIAAQETKESQPQDAKARESKPAEKPPANAAAPAYHPVPVNAAREVNPVKPTPESVASGKRIYGYDCALCHGASGDGKTNVGKEMKIPDLSDPATLKSRTDGELHYVIKNGRGEMPLEGDRAKPDQLWDLVNYVRSLSKNKTASEEPAK